MGKQLDKMQKQLDQVTAAHAKLSSEKIELETRFEPMERDLRYATADKETLESKVESIDEERIMLQMELEELKESASEQDGDKYRLETELRDLKEEFERLKASGGGGGAEPAAPAAAAPAATSAVPPSSTSSSVRSSSSILVPPPLALSECRPRVHARVRRLGQRKEPRRRKAKRSIWFFSGFSSSKGTLLVAGTPCSISFHSRHEMK